MRGEIVSITYLYWHIWELVKVARVIDRPDLDGDSGGPLPDVLPVHGLEPVQRHDLLFALNSTLAIVTKPKSLIGYTIGSLSQLLTADDVYYLLMVLTAVSDIGGTGGNSKGRGSNKKT